jgi:uncharacterized membrane-anchored protein
MRLVPSVKTFVASIIILIICNPCSAQNMDQIRDEASRMHWIESTTTTLPLSNSKLALPENYRAVIGTDAKRLDQLINGRRQETLEGYAVSPDGSSEIHFDYTSEGYVKDDDWSDINASELLQDIKQNTENSNELRRKNGMSEIHVVKWLQEPTFDKTAHTAYWAIEGQDKNGYLVNSIAIRLGRNGYEKLNSITSLNDYKPVNSDLEVMLRAFAFPNGSTYEDHIAGDKMAGYGLAALIGAVAGAKVLKIAAAGGLALFFKPIMAFLAACMGKTWFLLLAPFIWIRNRFKRTASPANPTAPELDTKDNEPPAAS